MTVITHNEKDTINEGIKLGQSLKPGDVVALYGGLGVGKTVFTRGVAIGLGLDMSISSPTFTIVNEYLGDIPLFHFDMYRLEKEDELFDIGWDDYLERGGICIVEWSEKVPSAFNEDTITVHIESISDNERLLHIVSGLFDLK